MPTPNPDCTPGWVDPCPAENRYISRCGCGWNARAKSRSEAKRLQREHRFPPFDDPATVNEHDDFASCWICGDHHDHHGVPHGDATGDELTRHDIIALLEQARGPRQPLFLTP